MLIVGPVIARLMTHAPALGRRVEGAMELAALMRSGGLPQVTPAAHVILGGLVGRRETAVTGLYRQQVERAVQVLVTFRAQGAQGARDTDAVEAVIEEVITALAGWTPVPQSSGPLRLLRSRTVSMAAGTIVHEIALALPDQLRIAP